MDPLVGYAIVSSIVIVMVWQAISHLNQGRRKPESLLGALKMEDIEVEDSLPPSRASQHHSLVSPRIEYSPEHAPFPTGTDRSNSDKRAAMKKEISELQEVNVERYSTLERSTEKMAECKAIIELIQGLSEEYGIEVNQELIESPLEGATLVELELRQTALLELYDRMYQLTFEDTIQEIRKRELSLQTNQDSAIQKQAAIETQDLTTQLEQLRREEELYREIRSAQTVAYLENLDFSELDEEGSARLKAHYEFYHSRLSEKERLEFEAELYRHFTDMIHDCEDQDELRVMEFEDLPASQLTELDERRNKRILALDALDKKEKEDARAAELRLTIESAKTSTELDRIQITGVNKTQEEELRNFLAQTRENLVCEELNSKILDCEYVLELDAISIQGVTEEQSELLTEIKAARRAELVEIARQRKFTEQYTRYLDSIPRIEDSEELLAVDIVNITESQQEELEELRLSRLDHLEEIERQRIERAQAKQYQFLRTEIETAKSSTILDEIEIEDVNEEQETRLLEIKEEIREILVEDEMVSKHVEQAEKKTKKAPTPDEFDYEPESAFRTRVKTLDAGDGHLRFSLLWDNMNDLDLIIRTPSGEIIHRGKRESTCGGIFDLEMNSQPEMKSALENIVWPKSIEPPPGTYNIFVWHRKRHQRLRKSDPTIFTLRSRVGADYFQHSGKLSFGDKLKLVAMIEVPDADTVKQRIESESELYRHQRADVMSAQSVEEFPTIDANVSSVHKVMLTRLMEKRESELEEAKRKKYIAEQEAQYNKIMAEIETARDLDELSAIRFSHVADDVIKYIEKAIGKRRKLIEAGIKKQEQIEVQKRYEDYRKRINDSEDLTTLASIVFEGVDERQAKALQQLRMARRKVMHNMMNSADIERDKQARLHTALNEAYKRGGLQPMGADEWRKDDFETRLQEAGANSGDLQVSLIWDNKNDFNLLVVTPSGEIVHPRNRESKDGGFLDIEMNQKGSTKVPVENAFWPTGNTPKGAYYVYVHFYKEHALFKKTNLSECRIQVLNKGERSEFSAQMSSSNKLQFVTLTEVR